MPEAAFDAAVKEVAAMLAQFPDMRPLPPGEVAGYGGRFQVGWAIPNLCSDPLLQLRVLLPREAPFFPVRIAVAPAPPVLAWPHLEDHGLLCLVSEGANVSIAMPAAVVMRLLDDARKLVNASLTGGNIQDFEDEFTSYWERWERTKDTINTICEPRGPSRTLTAWHATSGTYVAESEAALRSWLRNRFGEETVKNLTCWPVPLLWLPRPLRPSEYPGTISALRAALQEDPLRRTLLDATLLQPEPREKLIVLGMNTRRGVAFAGLRTHKLAGLQDGFRKRPPTDVVLSRYNAAATTGARAVRFDASWVHGRDQNPEAATLRAKKVMIIGLGSVGSSVADLLVKAGVGKVALVDPEALASANGSRHLLGATAVGVNKAAAVGQNLASRFPHLEGTAFAGQFTDAQQPIITSLRSADLILSLSGNWPAESLLDTIWRADSDLPPIVYGWTEPHAAAGHALVLMQDGGCLRCVLSDMGKARLPVTIWTENTLLQIPACGDMFQPYGATELAHIQALIAELALDVLLQRVADSTHRVWIGRHDLLTRAGGSWDPAWIAAYGDPGGGGQLRDIQFNAGCAECDTA